MKGFFYGLLLLCPICSRAQSRLSPLETGAPMPEIHCTQLLNTAASSIRLADYKDKLLVLDFWATWCGACIKGFPRLDSLQRKYRDQLQVLLVSSPGNDPPEKIRRFFRERRNPAGQQLALPVIWGDARFNSLFPHKVIPHSVWIYKGKYLAATSPEEITAEKLELLFSGHDPQLEERPRPLAFDPACSLQEQGWPLTVLRQDSTSLLAGYIPGAGVKIGSTPSAATVHRYYINLPLVALVELAWPSVPGNRIWLAGGLETEQAAVHNTAWKKQHWYSYELRFPMGTPEEAVRRRLQQALQKDFAIEVQLEKRWVDAFAITRIPGQATAYPLATGTAAFTRLDNGNWIMRQQPLTTLLEYLNQQSPGMPLVPIVIDETGDNRNYSMDFPFPDLHDRSCVKEVLQQQGLDIIPVKRELEIVTVRPALHHPKSN